MTYIYLEGRGLAGDVLFGEAFSAVAGESGLVIQCRTVLFRELRCGKVYRFSC